MRPALILLEQIEALPMIYRVTIPDRYRDKMGHMNMRYYLEVYDDAGDALFETFGLSATFYKEHGSGGFDLDSALNGLGGETSSGGSVATAPANESDSAELTFVKQVRSNVQDYWAAEFDAAGETYEPAGLVLFDSPTSTGCGVGSPETGPFYCPADKKVYFDLGFYRQMAQQFGIRGDTALAYVIAHEMGHHVQNELGINEAVRDMPRDEQVGAKGSSVRMELQADCLAGVWASTIQAEGGLEEGDFDEAINAAQAVGDDRIQETTQGRIEPESFTHGTAEQRKRWFARGFRSGDSDVCDTFGTDDLG